MLVDCLLDSNQIKVLEINERLNKIIPKSYFGYTKNWRALLPGALPLWDDFV
jgi:hypothetical protein